MLTLSEFTLEYRAEENFHRYVSELFIKAVNENPVLKEFRDFVEQHVYGFGEREFIWMHKILFDSIVEEPIRFLEIGVYKGQIPALYALLSKMTGRKVQATGITPLDETGGHPQSDYMKHIKDLHDRFDLPVPAIIKGLSTTKSVIDKALAKAPYDVVFIDGGHSYEVVKSDMLTYPDMVEKGGYLVVDDCANNVPGVYSGRFWGIDQVSKAVDEVMDKQNGWTYLGNVIHNRIWKREDL